MKYKNFVTPRNLDETKEECGIKENELIDQYYDAEKKFNKLVITGSPGSGKTTFLKHLALKSCLENMAKQERVVVPVLVALKEFFESKTLEIIY